MRSDGLTIKPIRQFADSPNLTSGGFIKQHFSSSSKPFAFILRDCTLERIAKQFGFRGILVATWSAHKSTSNRLIVNNLQVCFCHFYSGFLSDCPARKNKKAAKRLLFFSRPLLASFGNFACWFINDDCRFPNCLPLCCRYVLANTLPPVICIKSNHVASIIKNRP
jgi:hypothetical protein